MYNYPVCVLLLFSSLFSLVCNQKVNVFLVYGLRVSTCSCHGICTAGSGDQLKFIVFVFVVVVLL